MFVDWDNSRFLLILAKYLCHLVVVILLAKFCSHFYRESQKMLCPVCVAAVEEL